MQSMQIHLMQLTSEVFVHNEAFMWSVITLYKVSRSNSTQHISLSLRQYLATNLNGVTFKNGSVIQWIKG